MILIHVHVYASVVSKCGTKSKYLLESISYIKWSASVDSQGFFCVPSRELMTICNTTRGQLLDHVIFYDIRRVGLI